MSLIRAEDDSRFVTGVLLVCLAVAAVAFGREKCVTVRMTNCYARTVTAAHGPLTLCAEARVQPDPEHRKLALELAYADADPLRAGLADVDEVPEMLREPDKLDGPVPSSEIQLDGNQERIRHERKFRDLYGGTYLVTATVYQDEARKKVCGRATARVTIH